MTPKTSSEERVARQPLTAFEYFLKRFDGANADPWTDYWTAKPLMGVTAICPHGKPRLLTNDSVGERNKRASELAGMLKAGYTIVIAEIGQFTQTYEFCSEKDCKLPRGSKPMIRTLGQTERAA